MSKKNKMNDVLMIMNPRKIQSVIDSINSLDIPKVWFTAYTEKELEIVMNDFVLNTKYDNYILTSDDLVINKNSFNNIRNNASKFDVLTGYCNLYKGSKEMTLCLNPLTLENGKYPTLNDYNFCSKSDIVNQKNEIFRTYLSPFAITSIKRDVWLDIPFKTYDWKGKGVSSDHNFSYRAAQKDVKIYSHKNSFSTHLKKRKDSPMRLGWLVGLEPSKTVFEGIK